MSQRDVRAFLPLYQKYRYENQSTFYTNRQKEFEKANTQALLLSIIFMSLTVLAGGLGAVTGIPSWLKLACLLSAAIFPVLSTFIAAYNSLYGFEQQAKLYSDTLDKLIDAEHALATDTLTGLDDQQFASRVDKYVREVERAFRIEQGQWGQLAERFKPQE